MREGLSAKQRDTGADVSAWERELNELVYTLYGLTDEEIKLVEESGPDHAKRFVSQLSIAGRTYGRGVGHSKKTAEQAAAMEALAVLAQAPPERDE